MKAPKTIKALAKELCKREGKKKQVNIAQMTEAIGVFADLTYEIAESESLYQVMDMYEMLLQYGVKRKHN